VWEFGSGTRRWRRSIPLLVDQGASEHSSPGPYVRRVNSAGLDARRLEIGWRHADSYWCLACPQLVDRA
jgi:hypothetical protein